jgi:Fe-S cluster biosynthesis and repair protein YggX
MPDQNTPRGTADLLGDERRTELREEDAPELEERTLPKRENDAIPLIDEGLAESFRTRWQECQTMFVDEPRKAVQDADQLVAELTQQLARQFADERSHLEDQWSAGEDVSTEDLRLSLQRYRSFFNRLLQV